MPLNISGSIVTPEVVREYEYNSIIQDGLVLHLDARIFNTISGTTWYDFSGNSYHGTLINGPTFDSSNQGSIVFDNVNDYVDVTSFSATTLNNSTIVAWVKDTSADTNYRAIVQNNLASDDALYINPSNYLHWWNATSSTLTVSKNQWTFVAASHTYGTGILYYVNTSSQTVSGTFGDPTDWDFIRIGGHGGGDSERWGGNISQILIYNKALTSAEILHNYNLTKYRYGL